MLAGVQVTRHGGIAVLAFDNPPVGALSIEIRVALKGALGELAQDRSLRALVLTGGAKGFSAGADIGEFTATPPAFANEVDPRELGDMLDTFPVPVVAAIRGFALGGGLELAMACDLRIATPDARLGLPEINLGVLPGAGGTQRLPRLVGAAQALAMMLSGNALRSEEALKCGLVDRISEADLEADAIALAAEVAGGTERHPVRGRAIRDAQEAASVLSAARARAGKMRDAPMAAGLIVDCVEKAISLEFDAGLAFERAAFEKCLRSTQARALQHAFFAEREAGRMSGSGILAPRAIRSVGIVGGGTMGRGIAISFAAAGYEVTLVEVDDARASAAVDSIRGEFDRQVERGRLGAEAAAKSSTLVTPASSLDALGTCDLVIEAVFENLAIKLDTARQLGEICREGAIIASNTSTLDINVLAKASGRQADFIGLHFFSPANIMKLVEVVRGANSKPDAVLTAAQVVRSLHKVPVICGVCWGFVGNRMLEPYLREVEALLLEGATPSQIDRAIEGFGMAMGPCRMMDMAGVDVFAKVVIEADREGRLPDDPNYRVVCRELTEAGRHGQKSGAGFYTYTGRELVSDEESVALIRSLSSRSGIPQRSNFYDSEIVERCLFPLINEGYRVVGEGIVDRSSDIDVVWLMGYGFPRSLGGPMFYAGQVGAAQVVATLRHYASAQGDPWGYWDPAAGLLAEAAEAVR